MEKKQATISTRVVSRLLAFASHDFCPSANRYVYWLKQPIGWFVVGVVASILLAVFLEPRVWSVVGALLSVTALGVLWPWLAMRGASAEISFGRRRCREGDIVQVRVVVHNRWPIPLWGLTIEKGFWLGDEVDRPVAALSRAVGWSSSEFEFEFRPNTRGIYPNVIPELATGFPFGILRSSKAIEIERQLLVWPKTFPLASIVSLCGDISHVTGTLFDRPGNEGDIIGARPFRQGDRLRSVHWAQTARRDSPIVLERQAAARQLVVVVVDAVAFTQQPSDSTPEHPSRLDMAIRVAASIARKFHSHYAEVRFVIGELDHCLSPDVAGLQRLFDALAKYQDERSSPRIPKFDRKSLVLVLTSGGRRKEWERCTTRTDSVKLIQLGERPEDAVGASSRAWLHIDDNLDVAQQLRFQWERVCNGTLAK